MRTLGALLVSLALLAVPATAAAQERACSGTVKRPYTDARVTVSVPKGTVSCKTAKAVLSRYWKSSVTAFERSKTITYRGTKWRCKPGNAMSGALGWGCSTPKERTIVAGFESG